MKFFSKLQFFRILILFFIAIILLEFLFIRKEKVKITHLLKYLGNEQKKQNENLHKLFLKEHKKLIKNSFIPVFGNIRETVDEITELQNCQKFCYYLIMDTFFTQTESEKLLDGILGEKIIFPTENAYLRIINNYKDFEQKIIESNNVFYASFALILKDNAPNEKLENHIANFRENSEKETKNLLHANNWAGFGLVLEVVFIKQLVAIFSQVFSKIILTTQKTILTGTTAAISDGFFPIGDLVGGTIVLGGFIWSGYDFYHARLILPQKLRRELWQNVEKIKKESDLEFLKKSQKFYKFYQDSLQNLIEEL